MTVKQYFVVEIFPTIYYVSEQSFDVVNEYDQEKLSTAYTPHFCLPNIFSYILWGFLGVFDVPDCLSYILRGFLKFWAQ